MSCYRYYLPGLKPAAVTDDTLVALGLSERLRDCPLGKTRGSRIEISEIIDRGPDGGNGALIVPQPADRKGARSYHPDEFAWHKSQHEGGYWIVWDKLNPPTPEGLQRWETVSGVTCELGDGRLWQCPTIRTCVVYPAVPKAYQRLNGQMLQSVLPQYQRVWERSATWSLRLLEEHRSTPFVGLLGLEGAFDAAVECVGVNYRVSDEEASLLQLMNDSTIDAVMDAAVDNAWFDDITESQKKRELWEQVSADLRSSLRGPEDDSPPTSQAEPTSS